MRIVTSALLASFLFAFLNPASASVFTNCKSKCAPERCANDTERRQECARKCPKEIACQKAGVSSKAARNVQTRVSVNMLSGGSCQERQLYIQIFDKTLEELKREKLKTHEKTEIMKGCVSQQMSGGRPDMEENTPLPPSDLPPPLPQETTKSSTSTLQQQIEERRSSLRKSGSPYS